MGWAGGSGIAEEIWDLVGPLIPAARRKEVAARIVDIFEGEDCDTMDEAEQLMMDAGRHRDEDEGG
jgi:hypothetical protein